MIFGSAAYQPPDRYWKSTEGRREGAGRAPNGRWEFGAGRAPRGTRKGERRLIGVCSVSGRTVTHSSLSIKTNAFPLVPVDSGSGEDLHLARPMTRILVPGNDEGGGRDG